MKTLFFFLFLLNFLNAQQLEKLTTDPCNGITTVTYEGKTYNTVAIGDQCWLKENLDVGTMIPGAQNALDNGIIEKYCYDDDPNNCITYGGLYQRYEAMQYDTTEGIKGICPPGWHIPTKQEFETLSAAVDGDGNALKSIGQGTGTGAGTNTSGFSALLAGGRGIAAPRFLGLGYEAIFWGSTGPSGVMILYYGLPAIHITGKGYTLGFSIRAIKDPDSTTSVRGNEDLISEYALYQNYPNPFNPSTIISFSIPEEVKVNLAVYDLLGRKIETLVDGNLGSGQYKVEFNAQDLPSGIYFYRITAGNYTNIKKLQILK